MNMSGAKGPNHIHGFRIVFNFHGIDDKDMREGVTPNSRIIFIGHAPSGAVEGRDAAAGGAELPGLCV